MCLGVPYPPRRETPRGTTVYWVEGGHVRPRLVEGVVEVPGAYHCGVRTREGRYTARSWTAFALTAGGAWDLHHQRNEDR